MRLVPVKAISRLLRERGALITETIYEVRNSPITVRETLSVNPEGTEMTVNTTLRRTWLGGLAHQVNRKRRMCRLRQRSFVNSSKHARRRWSSPRRAQRVPGENPRSLVSAPAAYTAAVVVRSSLVYS